MKSPYLWKLERRVYCRTRRMCHASTDLYNTCRRHKHWKIKMQ